jgi:hypothetical protein
MSYHMDEHPGWKRAFWAVMMITIGSLLMLPGCGGIDLPCPPFCPSPPAEAWDCDNPPEVKQIFVPAVNPILDEFIIVMKPSRTLAMGQRDVRRLMGRYPELSGFNIMSRLGMLTGKIDAKAMSAILADPSIAFVQQSGRKYTTDRIWNLDRIDQRGSDLDGVYDPSGTGSSVNIAIIDTGVSPHWEFGDRLQEACFSAYGNCLDGHGHGTHVAGTAAGEEYGVANQALIYAVKVLADNGQGSDTDVIRGIEWVVDRKATQGGDWVINMSLGGSPAPALDDAVCKAIKAGVHVAVAAGNDSQDAYGSSPARVVQTVCVGAMQEGDEAAYFSNRGPGVDVYAPGVSILSAKPGGGAEVMQGTSMASPHVAGALALVAEGKTPEETHAIIVDTATEDALSDVPSDTVNKLLFVGKAPGPPPECMPGIPWCKDVGQTCSTDEKPCKTNPTQDPNYCELAPECPDPPPNPDCGFPQGIPNSKFTGTTNPGVYGSAVNRIMADLTGCAVGSDCPITFHPDTWMGLVCEEACKIGLNCGRHDNEPPGATDQISVKEGSFCDGKLHENYQIYNYGGKKVRWAPGGKQDGWFVQCNGAPPPTGDCPQPHPDLTRMKFNVHEKGSHLDTTWTTVNQCGFCEDIGMGEHGGLPRCGCPVRPECSPGDPPEYICHDRAPCEAELCDQKWKCNGEPYPPWRGNPAQTNCRGHWETWCSAPGSTARAEGNR